MSVTQVLMVRTSSLRPPLSMARYRLCHGFRPVGFPMFRRRGGSGAQGGHVPLLWRFNHCSMHSLKTLCTIRFTLPHSEIQGGGGAATRRVEQEVGRRGRAFHRTAREGETDWVSWRYHESTEPKGFY